MKIVAVSDTHTKHKQIIMPEGDFDVLVHAGDMTGRGQFMEFISIGNWFRAQKEKFKHRLMIAGNHDWGFELNAHMIKRSHFDDDVIYLQDRGVIIDGVKFYGTPWMPVFYNWAFMRDEDELAKYYALIPDDTEVLITHCPPFGILDRNMEADDQERCGSLSLLKRVQQLKNLKAHIFGHIHGGYGTMVVDGVSYHNVCSLNEQYKYQNPPQIIEIQ